MKIKAFRPQAIIYDFDGVMTDNKVFVFTDGQEAVRCNRSDGWAIGQFKKRGIHQGILSTEVNAVVGARAKKLGIPHIQGCENKEEGIKKYAKTHGLDLKKVFYVGNDDNDLPAFKLAGFKVCPADASPKVKKIVDLKVRSRGGEGVIRDLFEVFQDLRLD